MLLKGFMYFREVALNKSIHRASKKLGVSISSLQNAIRNLENEYNTRLFDRSSGSYELTNTGKLLFEHVELLIEYKERGYREISSLSLNRPIMLKIEMMHTNFSEIAIVKYFKDILKDKCDFKLLNNNLNSIIKNVSEEKTDIGIINFNIANYDNVINHLTLSKLNMKIFDFDVSPKLIVRKGHPLLLSTNLMDDIFLYPHINIEGRFRNWFAFNDLYDDIVTRFKNNFFVNDASVMIDIVKNTNYINIGLKQFDDQLENIPCPLISDHFKLLAIWKDDSNDYLIRLIDSITEISKNLNYK